MQMMQGAAGLCSDPRVWNETLRKKVNALDHHTRVALFRHRLFFRFAVAQSPTLAGRVLAVAFSRFSHFGFWLRHPTVVPSSVARAAGS
jgi:hypothetical protein